MPFIEKHKALLLTILIFMVLLLGLYNWHLGNNPEKSQEFLVDLEAFSKSLETPEEQPKQQEPPKPSTEETQTHRAFNQNNEAREANFNNQLNAIFEKNSAAQTESSEDSEIKTSGEYAVGKSSKKSKSGSDGDNSTTVTSKKSGSLKNSSISFNLKGRTAREIPNPIYTCSRSGKIVINIQVDAAGRVTSTSFNAASSSSDNKCLVENALLYASNARFSNLSGRNNQPGTITYQFKP